MGFFSAEDYKQGFNMGIGALIICCTIFPDTVESKFDTFPSSALSLVVWTAIYPICSGMATVVYILLALALLLGYCTYVVITYLTYAIAGPDFSPGPDKAITLCIVSIIIVALLQLMRVRIPILDGPGLISQILPNVISFTGFYYSSAAPQAHSPWRFVVLMAIPAVTGSLVSMFIVPHPAGQRSIELLGQFLDTTAELQNLVTRKLFLAGVDEKNGQMASSKPLSPTADNSNGKKVTAIPEESRYVGIAAELEPIVLPIHKLDIQAWQLAVGINGLALFSGLEIDVYNKQHIFPKKQFHRVLTSLRTVEHLYTTVVTFLESGSIPTTTFPVLKNELEELRAAVEMNCKTLKQVIVNGYEYEKGLNECVPRLEAACLALKAKMTENEKAQSNGGETDGAGGAVLSDELLVAHEMMLLVILAGKELRSAWERVPALIAVHQPHAAAVAESFFVERNEIITSRDDVGKYNTSGTYNGGNDSALPPPVAAEPAATGILSPPSPSLELQPFREVVKLTPSCSKLRLKLYQASLRTGIHTWHLKLVLHMTFVFAIAAILCVIPEANDALGEHAYWIIITIFVISENTTGAIVDNGIQRTAGTLLGSFGIAGLAGFAYLANGSSYNGSSTAMRVVQTAYVSIWMGVMQLFASKYSPRLFKFFSINILLVPLIGLLDSSGSDVWPHIGWRIVNTIIGVGLHTFASLVLFPVPASDHIKEKTTDCLLHISNMLDEIIALPLMMPALDSVLNSTSGGSGSGAVAGSKSTSAGFGCFKRKKNGGTGTTSSTASHGTGNGKDLSVEDSHLHVDLEAGETTAATTAAAAAAAAKARAIIFAGVQKADKSLLALTNLRSIVAKNFIVTKLLYTCVNSTSSSSSSSDHVKIATTEPNNDNNNQQQQKQQQEQSSGRFGFRVNKYIRARAPMHVYLLDQLITHLKHNIVYCNITLLVREWLRTQTVFVKRPELAFAVRAFAQQTSECFKALRLAILGLVGAEEALQTVLNLRKMAADINILCNNNGKNGSEEATIIHMMLMMCRNLELLYRATDRALVTRDEARVASITDEKLGGEAAVSILSLLNVEATATAVKAVAVEEGAAIEAKVF